MPTPPRSFWLVPLFVALYSAGGLLGGLLVVGPDGVVLLWPPGALSFVLLMREGRRKWWLVALADLTYSLVGSPAPLSFLPFSMAANVAGVLAASTVARRLGMRSGDLFHLGSVRVLLIAGATLALASLPFGLMGLVLTGVTPPSAVGDAAITWLVANVFGVLVLGPGISLLWRSQDDPLALPTTALVGFERSAWCVALGLSLTVVALTPHETVRNAAAVLAVPTIVLLWAAVRMPPRWAAAGCLVTGLALTLTAAFNLGALEEPKNTQEALILLMLLFTLMLAPLVLMAALEDGRQAANDALRRARIDDLTGLANRSGLQHLATESLARVRQGRPMLLALVDIDNFKLLNDAGGLAEGDQFLRSIGGLLRGALAPGDVIGRLAADQFVLLLHDVPRERAEGRALAIVKRIGEYRHPLEDGQWLTVSASVGAVPFSAGEAGFDPLLRLADAACATAKELGGDRLHLAEALGKSGAVAERSSAMRWAVRLDRALREGHFRLYCQSIVPLGADHGGRRHFEILLRLVDPDTGDLLPPGQFVPAAERFKMGPKLDRHVLDRTLEWLEASPHALDQIEVCAINLCAASVNDPGFLDFLRQRVSSSPVPADRLCLEITETSAVRDLTDAQAFIAAARDLGVRLALDDFGAGFCSFAYLRQLDVDFIKIDGSFTRDIETSGLSMSIVRSIAEIARGLDKRTVAEFVENDAIRLRLAQLGVDFGQGYGIDRPVPIEQYFHRPAPVVVPR